MSSELKDKWIARLREDYEKVDFGVNKDFKELIKLMIDNPSKILTIDDEFNFDNDICVTFCNGACCTNVDIIRISPVEVDAILESPQFKGQDRFKFVQENFELFVGAESLIPLGRIKFRREGNRLVCPFLRKAKKEVYGIHSDGKKEKLFTGTQGLCSIQQDKKPIVCMLYPLGRVDMMLHGDTNEADASIFYCRDCPGIHTEKKIKVRDIAQGYDILHKKREAYFAAITNIIKKLSVPLKNRDNLREVLHTMMLMLFVADGSTQEKIEELQKVVDSVQAQITRKT